MIRQAAYDDIPDIMKFIDIYWKKNHILAVDRFFFEYEYYVYGEVNFIISVNSNGIIEGILGYIRYDRKHNDIVNALWKVRDDINKPMLGIELLTFVINNCANRIVASPGINPKTIPIYKYLKYYTGKMNHFYRLNSSCKCFKIAQIEDWDIPPYNDSFAGSLQKFTDFSELAKVFSFNEYLNMYTKPSKEDWYVKKRYFKHPYYQYEVYGIVDKDKKCCQTILCFRKIETEGSACLRLVDIIGDYKQLVYTGRLIDELMQYYDCEYCDLYCAGIQEEILKKAGFKNRYSTKNIIPNYFEPYVQDNVDIWYFTTDEQIVLFKADGDQDRPSFLRKNGYKII